MGWLADETGLDKCAANHVPLTPLSHLRRAADIFPHRQALVDRSRSFTYAQMIERVTRLASALAGMGIKPGDVVATLLPNIAAQVEATWGVPACGAVLNTINTRLEVETVSYTFAHAGAKVVLVDAALLPLAEAA
uniref:AMP-binding protein n=1 Tax=Actibacterium sp. TaxID=1872125 RepID=UPI0035693E41